MGEVCSLFIYSTKRFKDYFMKYHYRLPILAFVATLGLVSQANAGLVNGGFENADYGGWELFEDSGFINYGTWGIIGNGETITFFQDTLDYNGGQLVAQFSPGVDPESPVYSAIDVNSKFLAYQLQNGPEMHRMYQNIIMEGGRQTVSWDMSYTNHAGAFDPDNQFLAVQILDTSDNPLATLFKTTNGVDNLSVPMTSFEANFFALPGQTVRLNVTLQAKGTATDPEFHFDAAFDNFKITAELVPEPTTFALMGLGLAGLQFSRRKVCAGV